MEERAVMQGIAPFGQDLAVLAYMRKPPQPSAEDNGEAAAEGHAPAHSDRPEVGHAECPQQGCRQSLKHVHSYHACLSLYNAMTIIQVRHVWMLSSL